MRRILPLLLAALACGLRPDPPPLPPLASPPPPPHFAIVVHGKAVLTDEQLIGYDWATHSFAFKPGDWRRRGRFDLGHLDLHGAPFTVLAEGFPCYSGWFVNTLSSADPPSGPSIHDYPFRENWLPMGYRNPIYPDIDNVGVPGRIDVRNDERVKAALRAAGKLRE